MDLITLISFLENLFASYGYPIVFFSAFIEITPLGFAIPGGIILAIAGFFAYSETIPLLGVLIFGWLGAWLTFLLTYILGQKTGLRLVRKFKQERAANRAKILLKKHGPVILTTSMLANLTRFWVAYIAGSQKYEFKRFFFYSGIAALTWTSLMVVIGYLAGSKRENLEAGIAGLGILAWLLLLVAIGVIYWVNKKESEELKNEL